jgi:hypothetical protein
MVLMFGFITVVYHHRVKSHHSGIPGFPSSLYLGACLPGTCTHPILAVVLLEGYKPFRFAHNIALLMISFFGEFLSAELVLHNANSTVSLGNTC